MSWFGPAQVLAPDKPWLAYVAFGAMHAPHHIWPEWADRYKGQFDDGWDAYREEVIARQKEMGIVPDEAELSPMLEGVPAWDSLSDDERRLFARMAEVYAGYMEHTDEQIGRVIDFLERDRPARQHPALRVRRRQRLLGRGDPQRPVQRAERHDRRGRVPGIGGAKRRSHRSARPAGLVQPLPGRLGLRRQHPLPSLQAVHPLGRRPEPVGRALARRDEGKGELRHQYHHCTDIVPTILEAIGIEAPRYVNTVQQEAIEGDSMLYTFRDADAPSTHVTQYFEMLGNRGLYHDGWKIVTYHGRKPWENAAAWTFSEDHWELYDLANDPAEAHDLMADRDAANLDDPMVTKCLDLVTLWWAEAGKYQVLPLDDRFQARALDREELYAVNPKTTWYEGAVRIQPFEAPPTLNRSWTMEATIEVPDGGATGPIAAMGGDSSGWSLYLNDGVPTYCYNFPGPQLTYIRAFDALPPGRHIVDMSSRRPAPSPSAPAESAASPWMAPRSPRERSPHLQRRLLDGRDLRHRLGQGLTRVRGLRTHRPVHWDDHQRRLRHPTRPAPRPRRTPRRGQGHQRHAPPVGGAAAMAGGHPL